MKQLLQNMRDGKTMVADIPLPQVKSRTALVRTAASLVSAGTERMLVDFAGKSLAGKAASRPDLVRQVLNKARQEGVVTAVETAFNRLDQPMSLGYSSAGVVIETGSALKGFQVGDRVACGGGGYAVHAEYAVVPQNLLVKLPDSVDFESAAFTTLGAVAMQGFRLANPQLGDRVCVIGLGLLGLLTCGIAHAAGCAVFGEDISQQRVELAKQFHATAFLREGCEEAAAAFTQNRGFDIVLICADTSSDDPVALAGALARDRGTIVAVGAVGMDIPRKPYYDKELTFKVSRSYGPGRYDPEYEEGGKDYPAGFVRWTEGRNMESFVELLAEKRLDVTPLITHRFEIERAAEAYDLITGKANEPFLGVLLKYDLESPREMSHRVEFPVMQNAQPVSTIKVGVLGAGNFANAVFLPAVKRAGKSELVGIASGSGLSASLAAKKFGFKFSSSDENEILSNQDVNTVILLTRHNLHARQVLTALAAGKNVYCEKPLAIHEAELQEIESVLLSGTSPLLTVGFNRRASPFGKQLQQFFAQRVEPMSVHYRVNAGYLPANHWLNDVNQGGGRIIGEGCHFIDFAAFLVGSSPVWVSADGLPDGNRYHQDNVHITLGFADGSLATVDYLANGPRAFPKERVEVFCGGKTGVLDDFRTLDLVSEQHHEHRESRLRQDKGHQAAWQAFCGAIQNAANPPIPYDQLLGVSRAAMAAVRSLETGEKITL
jgi:predicted dehydrogenase/threonine dehydrogenase-like Zn-dependent dehydrogenase